MTTMETETEEMDQALLRGSINVDEYATCLVREVDGKHLITSAQLMKERQAFLERMSLFLQRKAKAQTLRTCLSKWRQFVAMQKAGKLQSEVEQLVAELDASKHQVSMLTRQKKELTARVTELTDRRTHGRDVSDLALQVRELVQELEKVKAENAALVNKSETNMVLRSRRVISSSSSAENIPSSKQNEGVGKMVREFQGRVQRLEEELSNEKLKRANESAKRLEKESECSKYKRELEDTKAEIVSLQLRLARMEASGETGPARARPSFIINQNVQPLSKLPAPKPVVFEEEPTMNSIGDYREVTAANTLASTAPRKSFFKPGGAAAQNSTRKALTPLQETKTESAAATSGDCAQQ